MKKRTTTATALISKFENHITFNHMQFAYATLESKRAGLRANYTAFGEAANTFMDLMPEPNDPQAVKAVRETLVNPNGNVCPSHIFNYSRWLGRHKNTVRFVPGSNPKRIHDNFQSWAIANVQDGHKLTSKQTEALSTFAAAKVHAIKNGSIPDAPALKGLTKKQVAEVQALATPDAPKSEPESKDKAPEPVDDTAKWSLEQILGRLEAIDEHLASKFDGELEERIRRIQEVAESIAATCEGELLDRDELEKEAKTAAK